MFWIFWPWKRCKEKGRENETPRDSSIHNFDYRIAWSAPSIVWHQTHTHTLLHGQRRWRSLFLSDMRKLLFSKAKRQGPVLAWLSNLQESQLPPKERPVLEFGAQLKLFQYYEHILSQSFSLPIMFRKTIITMTIAISTWSNLILHSSSSFHWSFWM